METDSIKISIAGKQTNVSSTRIDDKTIVVTGKWIRIAAVHDEIFLEGEVVEHPELFITKLKEQRLKADMFTFAQRLPETEPKHRYLMEWDNVAAIPITSFAEWWKNRISRHVRQDVNRAKNRGVTVSVVEFNDDLVRGIIEIYNDTPIRQGRTFWHYGKDFDTVKRENSSYLERSDFLGAYYNGELIGFLKIVYVGKLAVLMQIVSKTAHFDKRPANALIAQAVELCDRKGCSYLTYGKYTYGKKTESSLADFKRRNGFKKLLLPKYYIPLTYKGRILLKLKLHNGFKGMLPEDVQNLLINARSRFYKSFVLPLKSQRMSESSNDGEKLGEEKGQND